MAPRDVLCRTLSSSGANFAETPEAVRALPVDLAPLRLTLSTLFGWLDHRFARLPHTIGPLAMVLLASLVLLLVELAVPEETHYEALADVLRQIDFAATVMEGMLAFLLFADAPHVDLLELRGRAWTVELMATVGAVVSTAVASLGFWVLSAPLGWPVPLAWALVFGALISPPTRSRCSARRRGCACRPRSRRR